MKKRMKTKILAVVLVFSLLLPVVPVSSINAVEAQRMPTSNEFAQNEPEIATGTDGATESESTAIVDKLTQGTQILKHIDETVFASQNHIARLEEEETLSSYVFLNSDGTKTVYYMDKEVKYQDSQGNVVEKDISLSNVANGYTTASNDVDLLLPNNPSNGIDFSYNGYDISIVPEGGELRKPVQSNGTSVIYPDYFGSGMSLMYTPSLDGLKEDIVLSRYTGVTSFAFRLYTDGLHLYQENGRCYLAQSETAEMRIDMGDVVSFDARGRFSVGTMTVETLSEGQSYRLVLTVDEDFLTAESTTYPVSIDPTLTVSDSTHGAGAIEDITLYSGRPNANCDWSYLHCGYYDSTYQVGRTLFRLTGLLSSSLYQALPVGAITSAEFHIKEATGTAALPVGIYANTGSTTWTETGATWNNAGYVVGTQYATASPGINEATTYDITNLVKAWKNNLESAQAGFILKSSNETTLDKAFYSSETTTASRRPYVVVTYSTLGENLANATEVSLSYIPTVAISTAREKKYYFFTPTSSGFYTFKSSTNAAYPTIILYNSDCEVLAQDSSTTTEYFRLTYHLIAGVTYYVAVGCYGQRTGTYTYSVSRTTKFYPPSVETTPWLSINSINTNAAYEATYIAYTAAATGKYSFLSGEASGDPQIWVYDSNFNLVGSNDNGGQNSNFRLEVLLTFAETYYLVLGHHDGAIGDYNVAALMSLTIPDGVIRLQNLGTELYLDFLDSVTQKYANQRIQLKTEKQRWLVQRQADGYYTIRSQYETNYYLGINSSNTGEDNVILSNTISDNTRWRIYAYNGGLLLEPKNALATALYAPDDFSLTDLQLKPICAHGSTRKTWCVGVEKYIEGEAQIDETACWAAASRMFVKSYYIVPNTRTQDAVVSGDTDQTRDIDQSSEPGGDLWDAQRAMNYYSTGSIESNTETLVVNDDKVLSEENLRRFLDDGYVLYITRGKYNEEGRRGGGHAYVITGYTLSTNTDGVSTYEYIILDSYPYNTETWIPPTQSTTARRYTESYQWIRNSYVLNDDSEDKGIWDGFIAVQTDYTAYINQTIALQ